MLAVRFRAIDGKGLSPFQIRAVVGRIHREVVLTSWDRHMSDREQNPTELKSEV